MGDALSWEDRTPWNWPSSYVGYDAGWRPMKEFLRGHATSLGWTSPRGQVVTVTLPRAAPRVRHRRRLRSQEARANTSDIQKVSDVRRMLTDGRAQKIRTDARIRVSELADHLGVTYHSVRSWETGRRRPQFDMAVRYADALAMLDKGDNDGGS